MTTTGTSTLSRERTDLLEVLGNHRGFLRYTAQGLSDDQARETPTASTLCIGGLIKHVTQVEKGWADFIRTGEAAAVGPEVMTEDFFAQREREFRLLQHETLAEVLAAYEETAAATDELVRTVDLDADHLLPEAPWFEPGATWSHRRALMHIATETAQHAGHADIVRETLDGQKTMG
ncbi:DinB family protein [Myceligenerans cantabricum]